ncbi:hypothetical protein V1514DRAFT_333029 [Lipomyces japonicus]|uniref:uncharacterized protein n=1 Tax=Lipomyces japonicus TaxID=56871 RepID=UPI0034CF7403
MNKNIINFYGFLYIYIYILLFFFCFHLFNNAWVHVLSIDVLKIVLTGSRVFFFA